MREYKILNRYFGLYLIAFLLVSLILSFSIVKAQVSACTNLKSTTLPLSGEYGGAGGFAVAHQSIAHPNPNVPAPVSVFLPSNATAGNRLPVVFFAHGYGSFRFQGYEDLLRQLASNGYIVVFAPYTDNYQTTHADRYEQMWSGFQIAVQHYGNLMDTTRIGFAGHSYGAGAVPELARRAVALGWGANGLFLFPMAAYYSWGNGYNSIPATAKLIVQVFGDDTTVDPLIAQNDIWNRLPQITERKWQVIRTAKTMCALNAGHDAPNTGIASDADGGGNTNGQDYWGIWRRLHALADYTFNSNAAAKDVAFGRDARMGRWHFPVLRPVNPLEATDSPVIDPRNNYSYKWADRCIYADSGTPCP
ncbi:MAG: hypothetical protein LH614_18390 [Pyrinomonadaceae bacterium]|nr:hypothetical protein [Pyrinomonadaceae bacterium]